MLSLTTTSSLTKNLSHVNMWNKMAYNNEFCSRSVKFFVIVLFPNADTTVNFLFARHALEAEPGFSFSFSTVITIFPIQNLVLK